MKFYDFELTAVPSSMRLFPDLVESAVVYVGGRGNLTHGPEYWFTRTQDLDRPTLHLAADAGRPGDRVSVHLWLDGSRIKVLSDVVPGVASDCEVPDPGNEFPLPEPPITLLECRERIEALERRVNEVTGEPAVEKDDPAVAAFLKAVPRDDAVLQLIGALGRFRWGVIEEYSVLTDAYTALDARQRAKVLRGLVDVVRDLVEAKVGD